MATMEAPAPQNDNYDGTTEAGNDWVIKSSEMPFDDVAAEWARIAQESAEQYEPSVDVVREREEHESAIARIGRLITNKAQELFNSTKAQSGHDGANQRALERDPNRDRAAFIEKNLSLSYICPSIGQKISIEDAQKLYGLYRESNISADEDRRPESRVGVLVGMEEILGELAEKAESAPDTEAKHEAERLLDAVSDLEAVAAIPQYIEASKSIDVFGNRALFEKYIIDTILNEGHHGANGAKNGGALKVERTMAIIDELGGDAQIGDIWKTINQDGRDGEIDWRAIVRFSEDGCTLQSYDESMRDYKYYVGLRDRNRSHTTALRTLADLKMKIKALDDGSHGEELERLKREKDDYVDRLVEDGSLGRDEASNSIDELNRKATIFEGYQNGYDKKVANREQMLKRSQEEFGQIVFPGEDVPSDVLNFLYGTCHFVPRVNMVDDTAEGAQPSHDARHDGLAKMEHEVWRRIITLGDCIKATKTWGEPTFFVSEEGNSVIIQANAEKAYVDQLEFLKKVQAYLETVKKTLDGSYGAGADAGGTVAQMA